MLRVVISCMKSSSLHLVVTEVVPVGGGVDKKSSCAVQYLILSVQRIKKGLVAYKSVFRTGVTP